MFQIVGKNDINLGGFHTIWKSLEKITDREKWKINVAFEVCRKILSLNLKGLDAIVLFGSVARGESRRGSDIDLLLLYENDEDALEAEDKTAKIAAETPNITVSVINKGYREFAENPHFAFEVLRDGLVLYKRLGKTPLKTQLFPLRLFYIYVFNLEKHSRSEKNRITVALYGRRKGKYVYKGLVESLNGYKLGRGAIMIPVENFRKIEEFFALNRITYKKATVNLIFEDLK